MPTDIDIPPPYPGYRQHRESADPATRRLLMIAGGLGGALVLLVGGWMELGRGPSGVPVIAAQSGPMRVKPTNRGGMQVIGANDGVMSDTVHDNANGVAPAPEVPEPQALEAQIQAARQAEAQASPAAPSSSASAAPATSAPAPTPAPAPMAAPAAPPVAAPAAPPARLAASRPAPVTAPHVAPGNGATQVQLAAMGTEHAAQMEWDRLSKRMPGLLDGHRPVVERIVEHDGRVFWRLRTGGFTDTASAAQFCAQIRAKGGGCSVADF